MNFKDIGGIYTRYLDENYNDIDRELYKYTETITIEKTKTEQDGSVVLEEDLATDETTNPLNINYKVYIGEEKNNNTIEDYITDQIDKTGKKYLGSDSGKIILYVYFEQNPNSEDYRIIKIKNLDGEDLLIKTEKIQDKVLSKVNLSINFSEYKSIDNSILKDVEINVYNQTIDIPNIYMEKNSSLNAYVNPCKGEINIYDNRAEDAQKARIGTLYDIKVEIQNKDGDIIFKGNSKQNIEW